MKAAPANVHGSAEARGMLRQWWQRGHGHFPEASQERWVALVRGQVFGVLSPIRIVLAGDQ